MGKKKLKKPQLTGLQESFCQHFVANRKNGTRAAESAGYRGSENTLSSQAYQNLRNPKIIARIKELQKEQLERLFLDSDSVLIMAKEVYEKSINGEVVTYKGEVIRDDEGEPLRTNINYSAANQAIKIIGDHNSINAFNKLEESDDDEALPVNVTFEVREPVKEIRITRGEGE